MLAINLVYTIGSCCQEESAVGSVCLAIAAQIMEKSESKNQGKGGTAGGLGSIFRLYKRMQNEAPDPVRS